MMMMITKSLLLYLNEDASKYVKSRLHKFYMLTSDLTLDLNCKVYLTIYN